MKKILGLTLGLLMAATAFSADALPVFNATLMMGKQNRFVLIGADGKPSSWLQLGDSFDGYTLKAFDAKAEALDLERDGKVTRLSLAADATVAAGAMPATPATLADAESVLNKMHFEQMMERMMGQQKTMMARMFNQMAPKTLSPEDKEEMIAFQKKMADELVSAMGLDQMKGDVARIYSEVFSKEELNALGSFYSTPTGEALVQKQPEVQQKMQEAMMPRMMAAMPKIQQMSRDFSMQMKAKHEAAAAAAAAAAAPAEPSNPTPPPSPTSNP
jgi:uncharacterized protein